MQSLSLYRLLCEKDTRSLSNWVVFSLHLPAVFYRAEIPYHSISYTVFNVFTDSFQSQNMAAIAEEAGRGCPPKTGRLQETISCSRWAAGNMCLLGIGLLSLPERL